MKIPFTKFVHLQLFERVIEIVFAVMLLFMTLSIVIGAIHLFLRLGDLITWQEAPRHYVVIVSDVLTLFILIDLSRSLADYFTTHRLRMTFIVDAGIVFILREIVVKLFEEKIDATEIYAFSALIAVLGALRIASVLVFQREKTMLKEVSRAPRDSDRSRA